MKAISHPRRSIWRLRQWAVGALVAGMLGTAGGLVDLALAGEGGLATMPASNPAPGPLSGPQAATQGVSLPGHLAPTLSAAERIPGVESGDQPLVLTIVLRRDDQQGFEDYLRAVHASTGNTSGPHDGHDSAAAPYGFLTPAQQAERFGPAADTYESLSRYLQAHGFSTAQVSPGRQTLTVVGTRAAAREAFAVEFHDYSDGERHFFATNRDPVLPAQLAPHVEAIMGLNGHLMPRPVTVDQALNLCGAITLVFGAIPVTALAAFFVGLICTAGQIAGNPSSPTTYCGFLFPIFAAICSGIAIGLDPPGSGLPPHNPPAGGGGGGPFLQGGAESPAAPPPGLATGAGQTIGVASFSSFNVQDVADWLAAMGHDPAKISQLSVVPVNGGAGTTQDETEVLLDIAGIWSVAPDASIRVYHAPFAGPGASFQALFSAMIDDGVDIITNSFAYCENNTSAADVNSINSILQTAALAGISVFSASGDTGATCLNGSASTAHVPASSPNLTAVGGSKLTFGPGFTYGGESWWNGSSDLPPTGQGGYGLSAFFARPTYQDGVNLSSQRSIPDVVVNADPATGFILCQASDGGCPTGKLYGGTSVAAPVWAGFTALLNEANGSNLGFLNPLLYPHAGTEAFHSAASMGSDFAHVGLGSPNLDVLLRQLNAIPEGMPDPTISTVRYAGSVLDGVPGFAVKGIPADGVSAAVVVVTLRDADGHTVSGRNVTLTPDSIEVDIDPAGEVMTDSNGQAVFQLRNLEPEIVMLTAQDVTSATNLDDQAIVPFGVPPAASAGIAAFPTLLNADGIASTSITVTLLDSLGRPAPGKEVRLDQGSGHSVITGPVPPVTDALGEIEFTAVNRVNETVTYTARVLTDIELPVPGNVEVTFQNGAGGCGSETPPAGANGYSVEPFANGFDAGPLFYGNINFGNCIGAGAPAFRDQRVYVGNARTGDVFEFGPEGGAAGEPLANLGPTLHVEAVGKDGRLYARRIATTGDFTTGAIYELDPGTGAILRTVASGLKCPHNLAVDPLSGDLFYDTVCFGGGSDDAAIHRVRNPGSGSPSVEVYTTLSTTPNGWLSFAPDGTLFAVRGYLDAQPALVRISGTDGPVTPTVEVIPDLYSFYWVNVAAADEAGAATKLLVLQLNGLNLVDLTQEPYEFTVVATDMGGGVIGPDGCLYAPAQHTTFRLRDPDGGCSFLPGNPGPYVRLAISDSSPAPVQGSVQQLVASVHGYANLEDVPVQFQVSGVNSLVQQVRTDADGRAELRYTAVFPGLDRVTASAVDGVTEWTSNTVELDIGSGVHVSELSLNGTTSWGAPGVGALVCATLVDRSEAPPVAVVGETVEFNLGAANCFDSTDASGEACCSLVPAGPGSSTLVASFAGTPGLTPAEDSITFGSFANFVSDILFRDGFENP